MQFIIVDFQTQFIDNKRKLRRENQWKPLSLEKVISCSGHHSFQWKLFCLVEAILFIGNHFVYCEIFLLVKEITFNPLMPGGNKKVTHT